MDGPIIKSKQNFGKFIEGPQSPLRKYLRTLIIFSIMAKYLDI